MISISPFPPPLPSTKEDPSARLGVETADARSKSPARTNDSSKGSIKGPRQPVPVANTPENAIHIASSSIDGNICVSSLVDPKDVLLRNFGRPVQAVAISPEYRHDRSYISGGRAGQLVLTVGGRAGASANANTTGAAAAAAGWLQNIGIGGNSGTDTVLHSGEGSISTIKWSLSGRYLVWINETGIKFMRTNLYLESHESEFAWKRMNNIARPKSSQWDEMAGIWAARAEWINEDGLEANDSIDGLSDAPAASNQGAVPKSPVRSVGKAQKERVLIGWGGTIWVVDVHRGGVGTGKELGEKKIGRPEVVAVLNTDCTICGVSQFTPNLILVLAYITPDDKSSGKATTIDTSPKRGISKKQNAVQPEMRIIDIVRREEVCVADTLTVSRFESLSAADYHLGVLPVIKEDTKTINHRGALEVIGDMGGTIWDAALYPTKFFSSAASIMSSGSTGDSVSGKGTESSPAQTAPRPNPALLTRGMKVFIQSPYDCVLATKLSLSDHLAWLFERERYEEAWNLLNGHPQAASEDIEASTVSTPTASQRTSIRGGKGPNQGSLVEFFADDTSQTASGLGGKNSLAEKEKRFIGSKWLKELVDQGEWLRAGQVAGKVLTDTPGWEHWAFVFADAKHFDEIASVLPAEQLRPPLSSTVFEVYLGHYLSYDIVKFSELLERWPPELFDVASLIAAVESKLKVGGISEETVEGGEVGRDWRLLTDALARLYLADGRARDALKLYIKLKDADAAMALIASHNLLDAVIDDIPGLVLLRVSKEQRKSAPLSELEEATIEPIRLLVTETCQGIIRPETVLKKLQAQKNMQPYQYFYLRSLWSGEALDRSGVPVVRSRRDMATDPLATEGKSLVNDAADEALPLFAEYDRDLLFEFLKSSQSYTLSKATSICEQREFVPEMVYLLAKEGQTKKALRLIIDKLGDVSQAIAFAKEQDDADLWNDLLNLSMKKPAFIRALLEEVGTAIDPITLVRRIPEGLEIVGLREALTRMMREYELQDSISEGAARVLRSEVAVGMAELRGGQKRGIIFRVSPSAGHRPKSAPRDRDHRRHRIDERMIQPGRCCFCGEELNEYGMFPNLPPHQSVC